MTPEHETATMARLMAAFARRTGLSPATDNLQRYLWTDAFAVGNFLELFERTGDQEYRRAAVPATGLHDALDGFITFREVEHAIAKVSGSAAASGLNHATEALFALCEHGQWETSDPLGVGGLLFDACRLCQLLGQENRRELGLLEDVLQGSGDGLMIMLSTGYLKQPARHRLAFRELGLAIGLRTVPIIANTLQSERIAFGSRPSLPRIIERLRPYKPLSDEIIEFWLPYAERPDETWKAHGHINEVMLATAIAPNTFLSVDERIPMQVS